MADEIDITALDAKISAIETLSVIAFRTILDRDGATAEDRQRIRDEIVQSIEDRKRGVVGANENDQRWVEVYISKITELISDATREND